MNQSNSRSQKTQATRTRLFEQAADLFLTHGYSATSTRQIAEAAEVTERTLFNIVPSKSELLRQVVLSAVIGPSAGPLLRREDFTASLEATSLDEFVEAFVAAVVSLHARSAALAEVVRQAAAVDPGAAEFWAWGTGQQLADCRQLVRDVQHHGWLGSARSAARVADSLAVLSGHETFYQLVHQRGWSLLAYRRWLHQHCLNDLTG